MSLAQLNSNFGFEYGSNENGYYKKYNNGLLEMWGSANITTVGYASNVKLPIAYSTNAFRVFVTPVYSNPPIGLICSCQQVSPQMFTVYGRTHDGKTPPNTNRIWWHTIGVWK